MLTPYTTIRYNTKPHITRFFYVPQKIWPFLSPIREEPSLSVMCDMPAEHDPFTSVKQRNIGGCHCQMFSHILTLYKYNQGDFYYHLHQWRSKLVPVVYYKRDTSRHFARTVYEDFSTRNKMLWLNSKIHLNHNNFKQKKTNQHYFRVVIIL